MTYRVLIDLDCLCDRIASESDSPFTGSDARKYLADSEIFENPDGSFRCDRYGLELLAEDEIVSCRRL